jgi:hypothetical protein
MCAALLLMRGAVTGTLAMSSAVGVGNAERERETAPVQEGRCLLTCFTALAAWHAIPCARLFYLFHSHRAAAFRFTLDTPCAFYSSFNLSSDVVSIRHPLVPRENTLRNQTLLTPTL